MRVAALGAGSWGTTGASLVAPRHPTMPWARRSEVARAVHIEHTNPSYLPGFSLAPELYATGDLEEAVTSADLVTMGVPTAGFQRVLENAAAHIRPWIPVVSPTKGLESESLLRMTEVIEQVLPGPPRCSSGRTSPGRSWLARPPPPSWPPRTWPWGAPSRRSSRRGAFRVYLNQVVVRWEIGGALKNVIAIVAGIGQRLGVGDNTRAVVTSRGLAELTRLGVALGAQRTTFSAGGDGGPDHDL